MTTVDTYPVADPLSERHLAGFRRLIQIDELPAVEIGTDPNQIIRALVFDDTGKPKAAAQMNFDPKVDFGLLTVSRDAKVDDVIELIEALRPEAEWRGLDRVLVRPEDGQRELYLAIGFENDDFEDELGLGFLFVRLEDPTV